MSQIRSYKDLIVWQKALILVKNVYFLTEKFPQSELYGLVSQIRRCVVSIPSNIAEGYGRKSSKEFAQFYAIAYGSALELETQLIIAKELQFITAQEFAMINETLGEVLRMLNTLTSRMRNLGTIR